MEIRLDRYVALVAVFLCLVGQTSRAEVDPAAEAVPEPNWIPSIDIGFDIFEYETTATVTDNIGTSPLATPVTHLLMIGRGNVRSRSATPWFASAVS